MIEQAKRKGLPQTDQAGIIQGLGVSSMASQKRCKDNDWGILDKDLRELIGRWLATTLGK